MTESFQARVRKWLLACFGAEIASDKIERNHRFIEEALELVQALGCTADEAHELVDYVYGRPIGKAPQEVGGVMLTLAALCLANGLDMLASGEDELIRVWTTIDRIRAKQAAKPRRSPLPCEPAADEPAIVHQCRTCRYWDALDDQRRKGDCRAPNRHRYWHGRIGGQPVFIDSFGAEETLADFSCGAWDAGLGDKLPVPIEPPDPTQPPAPEMETRGPKMEPETIRSGNRKGQNGNRKGQNGNRRPGRR